LAYQGAIGSLKKNKNMRKRNNKELIKELKYAQKLHKDRANDLELSVNERKKNKRVEQQKEIIIQMLEKKVPFQEKYIRIMKRWLNIHQKWIEYFKYYLEKINQKKLSQRNIKKLKTEIEEEGGIDWHKRWVEVYKEVISSLEKLKK